MDKSEFKNLLFELLNEYGEQALGLADIVTYNREDKFVIVMPDEHKFEICVKQLT